MKIVQKEALGLTPDRLRGICESSGDLLVFVDDDSVLALDFLEIARRIMEQRRYLGSWSGQCRSEFEEPPQEWTRCYSGNLSIREFSSDVWSNLPRLAATMLYGAGLRHPLMGCRSSRLLERHGPMLEKTGCGWWVEPAVDGIAEDLQSATNSDLGTLQHMGKKGRHLVSKQFGWSRIASLMRSIYEAVLKRSTREDENINLLPV